MQIREFTATQKYCCIVCGRTIPEGATYLRLWNQPFHRKCLAAKLKQKVAALQCTIDTLQAGAAK